MQSEETTTSARAAWPETRYSDGSESHTTSTSETTMWKPRSRSRAAAEYFGESDDVERNHVLAEPADARAEVGLVDERGGVLVRNVVFGAPRRRLAVERDDVDLGEARATHVMDPVMEKIAEFGGGEGHRQRGSARERVQGVRGGRRRRGGRRGERGARRRRRWRREARRRRRRRRDDRSSSSRTRRRFEPRRRRRGFERGTTPPTARARGARPRSRRDSASASCAPSRGRPARVPHDRRTRPQEWASSRR